MSWARAQLHLHYEVLVQINTDELQWLAGPGQGGVRAGSAQLEQPACGPSPGRHCSMCVSLDYPSAQVQLYVLQMGSQASPNKSSQHHSRAAPCASQFGPPGAPMEKTWGLLSLDEMLWQPHWDPSTAHLRGFGCYQLHLEIGKQE